MNSARPLPSAAASPITTPGPRARGAVRAFALPALGLASLALLASCGATHDEHAAAQKISKPAAAPPPAAAAPATKSAVTPADKAVAAATPAEKAAASAAAATAGAQDAKSAAAPARSLDAANFDKSCKPCDDAYQFTNGGWMAANPVPPEYSSWNVFSEVRERNYLVLKGILDSAMAVKDAPKASVTQLIGDFYCSCMDEGRAEREGIAPLAPEFARIDAVKDVAGLQEELAHVHAQGNGQLFAFFAEQDPGDATTVIAHAFQGGLGLPDRDYYTRDDERSVKLRADYLAHVTRMFGLLGEDGTAAAAHAAAVMEIETRLAKASMTNVELRDPKATYHKLTVAEAAATTPGFDWTLFLQRVGAGPVTVINVGQPAFFKEAGTMLTEVPLDAWKTYLRWHLAHDFAPTLSAAFVNENFGFYGTTLTGQQQLQPRWKRCLQRTDAALGEALGQAYVAQTFTPRAKSKAKEMVGNLQAAFRERIRNATWMNEDTRKAALAKLEAFTPKIGYPDTWRDYSALSVDRGPFALNQGRADAFEFRRILAKIGKPVDRAEWGMSPPTVNAYYNPALNEIVFPAGILQPPYFSEDVDDAVNYGAMGAVIGHEMTHGFDDQGSQYDAQGNLRDWWTAKDREEFERRAGVVEHQFSDYVAIDDLHVNGKLTLGENIADLGGLTIAYHAYVKSQEGKPAAAAIDGFTPQQRFFLAWAQAWRNNIRPEALRLQVNTNPHSPGRFRGLGPLSNMPEFAAAFGCKAGDAMVVPEDKRAQIW
ncbi:MAG TPA: M13 family metallopeptidase [Planctomycetota bacterium]|nr:M13 family metallopeptidase [Planctomycetota bacterium]